MIIELILPPRSPYPGKLADVELHFDTGDLAGLRLVGFSIWSRRAKTPDGDKDGDTGDEVAASNKFPLWNVTFPSVPGKKGRFALLRSRTRPPSGMLPVWALRDAILTEYERAIAPTSDWAPE